MKNKLDRLRGILPTKNATTPHLETSIHAENQEALGNLDRRTFLKSIALAGITAVINPKELIAQEEDIASPEEKSLIKKLVIEILSQELEWDQLREKLSLLIERKDLISPEEAKAIADKMQALADSLPEESIEDKKRKSELLLEGPAAFYGFYGEKLYEEKRDTKSSAEYGARSYHLIRKSITLNRVNIAAIIAIGEFIAGLKKHTQNIIYGRFAKTKIEKDFRIDIKEELENAITLIEETLANPNLTIDSEQKTMVLAALEKIK